MTLTASVGGFLEKIVPTLVCLIIVFKGNLQLTCQRVVPNNRVERIFPTLGQKQMAFLSFYLFHKYM